MKNHLSENASTAMTIVNPPPVQEMNPGENKEPVPSESASGKDESPSLGIQPL